MQKAFCTHAHCARSTGGETPQPGFLHLVTADLLNCIISCCVWPVRGRGSCGIAGLHTFNARSSAPFVTNECPQILLNISQCGWRVRRPDLGRRLGSNPLLSWRTGRQTGLSSLLRALGSLVPCDQQTLICRPSGRTRASGYAGALHQRLLLCERVRRRPRGLGRVEKSHPTEPACRRRAERQCLVLASLGSGLVQQTGTPCVREQGGRETGWSLPDISSPAFSGNLFPAPLRGGHLSFVPTDRITL